MVAYSFKPRFAKPIEVGLSSVQLSFDPPARAAGATGTCPRRGRWS